MQRKADSKRMKNNKSRVESTVEEGKGLFRKKSLRSGIGKLVTKEV